MMSNLKLTNELKFFIVKDINKDDIVEYENVDFNLDLQEIFPDLIIKNIFSIKELQEIINNEYSEVFKEAILVNELNKKIYQLKNLNEIHDIDLKISLTKLFNNYNLINDNYMIVCKFTIEPLVINNEIGILYND